MQGTVQANVKLPHQGKTDVMVCKELNQKTSSIGPLQHGRCPEVSMDAMEGGIEMFGKVTDLGKAGDARLKPKVWG